MTLDKPVKLELSIANWQFIKPKYGVVKKISFFFQTNFTLTLYMHAKLQTTSFCYRAAYHQLNSVEQKLVDTFFIHPQIVWVAFEKLAIHSTDNTDAQC